MGALTLPIGEQSMNPVRRCILVVRRRTRMRRVGDFNRSVTNLSRDAD